MLDTQRVKGVAVLLLTVVSLLSATGDDAVKDGKADAESAGWQLYRNEEFGFELKYPGHWEPAQGGAFGGLFIFRFPVETGEKLHFTLFRPGKDALSAYVGNVPETTTAISIGPYRGTESTRIKCTPIGAFCSGGMEFFSEELIEAGFIFLIPIPIPQGAEVGATDLTQIVGNELAVIRKVLSTYKPIDVEPTGWGGTLADSRIALGATTFMRKYGTLDDAAKFLRFTPYLPEYVSELLGVDKLSGVVLKPGEPSGSSWKPLRTNTHGFLTWEIPYAAGKSYRPGTFGWLSISQMAEQDVGMADDQACIDRSFRNEGERIEIEGAKRACVFPKGSRFNALEILTDDGVFIEFRTRDAEGPVNMREEMVKMAESLRRFDTVD